MSQEEPDWRAELVEDLSKYDAYASQWLPLVEPHIQAAEERGRRQALTEAADLVGDNATCGCSVCRSRREVADLLRFRAEQP